MMITAITTHRGNPSTGTAPFAGTTPFTGTAPLTGTAPFRAVTGLLGTSVRVR